MSTADFNITPATNTINMNYNDDEQYVLNNDQRTAMKTANVGAGRENQRDGGKGERERREDDVERILSMREQERTRAKQTSTTTDSVTSFTNEQDNRSNIIIDAMTQRVSSSLSNNHSQLYHSASPYPRYSMDDHFHDFLAKSPYRTIHHLDEDILSDEILEVIHFNHYPTLLERWGDDTKTIVRQEGPLKIEDYVEFEELEPTVTEEICYEISYAGDQIQSTREIHHSRSESRNFRKIRKRRIKRQRPTHSISTQMNHHKQDSTGNTYEITTNDNRSANITTKEPKQTYHNVNDAKIDLLDDRIANDVLEEMDKSPLPNSISTDGTSGSFDDDVETIPTKELQSTVCSTDPKAEHNSNQDLQSSSDIFLSDEAEQIDPSISTTNDRLSSNQMKSEEGTIETVQPNVKADKLTSFIEQQTVVDSSIVADHEPVDENVKVQLDLVNRRLSESSSDDVYEILPTPTAIHRPFIDEVEQIYQNLSFDLLSQSTEQSDIEDSSSLSTQTEASNDFATTSNGSCDESIYQTTTLPETSIFNTTDSTAQHSLKDQAVSDHNISSAPADTPREPPFADEATALFDSPILRTGAHTLPPIIETLDEILVTDSTVQIDTPSVTVTASDEESLSMVHSSENQLVVPTSDVKTATKTAIEAEESLFEALNSPISQIETKNLSSVSPIPSVTEKSVELDTPVAIKQSNRKETTSDLTTMYYELQEQRHRPPTFAIALSVDVNTSNRTQDLNLQSFSSVSHLPFREYRQVFGVSDEIVSTLDDLTYCINQTHPSLGTNEEVKPIAPDINQQSQIIEIPDTRPAVVSSIEEEKNSTTTRNIVSYVELDSRYASLLNRIDAFINSLIGSSAYEKHTTGLLADQSSANADKTSRDSTENNSSSTELSREQSSTNISADKQSTEETSEGNHLSNIQSIPDAQEQEMGTKQSLHETNSRSTIEKLIPASNDVLSTVQIQLTTSTDASSNSGHQQETSPDIPKIEISPQTLIDHEEGFLSNSNQMDECSLNIPDSTSDLHLSDPHTVVIMSPSSSPDRSIRQTEPANDSVDSANERFTITPELSITPSCPWYSRQSKITDTASDLLLSAAQSSTDDLIEHAEIDEKPSHQRLQVIADDYPWYSSYYSIVDAETKMAALSKQSNHVDEQTVFPGKVQTQSGSQDKFTSHEDNFEDINGAHSLRSPHDEEYKLSTSLTADLKPSDPVEQADVFFTIPLTSDIAGKKKPKKKNKAKRNITTTDPNELTSQHTDTQIVSTAMKTQTDDLKNTDHPTNTTSTVATTLDSQADTILQSNKQQSIDKEPHLQITSPSVAITTKLMTPPDEDEDNDGFQLVRYHKRILSATKSVGASEQTSNSTIDSKTPIVTTAVPEDIKPKKKRNKHKKQKKETVPATDTTASEVGQESVDEEIVLPSLSTSKDTDAQSTLQTVTPTESEPAASLEGNEDDEGFQVVSYRKRLVSAARSEKVPASPSPTKTAHPKNFSGDANLKSGFLHERHSSTPRSVPRTTGTISAPPNKNKHQTTTNSVSSRSVSIEPRPVKSTDAQSRIKSKTTSDVKSAGNQLSPPEQLTSNQPIPYEESVLPTISTAEESNDQRSTLIQAEDAQSSTLNNTDSIPLSVEETLDQQKIEDTRQTPDSKFLPIDHTSTGLGGKMSTNTTFETAISCTNKSVRTTNNIPGPSQTIDSTLATPSTNQTVETITKDTNVAPVKEIRPSLSIEPMAHAAVKKRRKKTSHTQQKPNDDIISAPSMTIANTSSTDPLYSQPTTAMKTVSSSVINDKLDLFLPEYIRQQTSLNRTSPPIDPNTVLVTSKPDVIPKKKQRPKMLNKDHEAKSLLTNEFDIIKQQTLPLETPNSLTQTVQSDAVQISNETLTNTSDEQPIDDILSRGFHLWLEESQTLTQQKPKLPCASRLTHAMHSIVIQPVETTANNENDSSSSALSVAAPIYTVGVRSDKRIHSINSYFIHHPQSTASSSWFPSQSDDQTSHDRLQNFDSDDRQNPKQHPSDNPSADGNNPQQPTSTVNPTDRSINNKNCSTSFDDWAHFYEPKSTFQIDGDMPTTFSCFYSRAFDEDTLLSDTNPFQHPKQRYGDFLSSSNDCLISESSTALPSYQFKPSEYFENYRKQRSTSIQHSDDDEISLAHSRQGVSRRLSQ